MLTHIRCVNQAVRFIIHPHHDSCWRVLHYFSLSSPIRSVLSPDIFLSFSCQRASGLVRQILTGYYSQPAVLTGPSQVIRLSFEILQMSQKYLSIHLVEITGQFPKHRSSRNGFSRLTWTDLIQNQF